MKNRAAILLFATMILLTALIASSAQAEDPSETTPKPEPDKNPTVETPVPTESDKELDELIKQFTEGDEAKIKAAHDGLAARGEAAVDRLFGLLSSEDKALVERISALLKEMGMTDEIYARMDLYRPEFTPGELIGVRFIVKNYRKDPVTVFRPSEGLKPARGLKLTLKDATTGKTISEIDLNAKIRANTGIAPTGFVLLKPGDRYEDVLELREIFRLGQITPGKYVITGAYSDKCARSASLTQSKLLKNFYPGEIEFKPLEFTIKSSQTAPATPEQIKRIKELIEELGDNSYKVRIKAETELEKIGAMALPYLKEARDNHEDLQVRETAYKIIQVLDIATKQQNTYIGINLKSAKQGVGISIVEKNSPADKGGMRVGDAVIKVNDEEITGDDPNTRNTNLIKRIRYRKVGETVIFTVIRNGKQIELKITLGSRSN